MDLTAPVNAADPTAQIAVDQSAAAFVSLFDKIRSDSLAAAEDLVQLDQANQTSLESLNQNRRLVESLADETRGILIAQRENEPLIKKIDVLESNVEMWERLADELEAYAKMLEEHIRETSDT